jgi:hypothetical protein
MLQSQPWANKVGTESFAFDSYPEAIKQLRSTLVEGKIFTHAPHLIDDTIAAAAPHLAIACDQMAYPDLMQHLANYATQCGTLYHNLTAAEAIPSFAALSQPEGQENLTEASRLNSRNIQDAYCARIAVYAEKMLAQQQRHQRTAGRF